LYIEKKGGLAAEVFKILEMFLDHLSRFYRRFYGDLVSKF
jgi:hypothetical protein